MTKRSETPTPPPAAAGAPKPPSGASPKQLREYKSRAEREAQIQRYVILGTLGMTAVVVVILLLAFAVDLFIRPNQAVASVNGTTLNVAEFEQRVRLERAIINERLNAIIAESRTFGDQSEQYLNFRLGQEPYASWLNEIQVADQLGNRVLNDMIDEVLIRQQAQELGVSVSDAEIRTQIEQFFEYIPVDAADAEATAEATETEAPTTTPTPFVSPTPSPTPTSTPTPEATSEATAEATGEATGEPTADVVFTPVPTPNPTERAEEFNTTVSDTFAAVRAASGASDEQINAYFEARALRVKLAEEVELPEVTTTQTEADVRHILVATEEEARDVLDALNAGESFAALARALSTDQGSAQNGGEYDWTPIEQWVEPFRDYVRDGEIGAYSEPIQTDFGYHIIQVQGKRETPLEETGIEAERLTAYDEYLDAQRDAEDNSIEIFSIWADNVPSDPPFIPRS